CRKTKKGVIPNTPPETIVNHRNELKTARNRARVCHPPCHGNLARGPTLGSQRLCRSPRDDTLHWIALPTDENTLLAWAPSNRTVPATSTIAIVNIMAYSATSWAWSSNHSCESNAGIGISRQSTAVFLTKLPG